MKNKVKFGARISRTITTRAPSGITNGLREDGKSFDREIVIGPPYPHVNWKVVKEVALEVERLGFDSLIVPDHLMLGTERFEAWTILSALGAITSRVRLGHLVLCYAYRGLPSIFAKQFATLDHITNGRLELGIGAGYEKKEFEAYGVGWRSGRRRVAELDEFLDILKLMWIEDEINYNGKYYKVKNAICEPKPIQKPYPPIILGGKGREILKVAAKHANWVNLTGGGLVTSEDIYRVLGILEKHCDSIGRDPSEIGKSWGEWVAFFEDEKDLKKNEEIIKKSPRTWCGTPEQYVDRIQEYLDLGITYITPRFVDLPINKSMVLFSERVMPRFRS